METIAACPDCGQLWDVCECDPRPAGRCPECGEVIYDVSMHPKANGDWTARCILCLGLLYTLTDDDIVYPERKGE